ncbi:hypothetical protein [Pedobacter sp. D749]|nr:hypothetical protein [Pedobacter sp. D749]
MSLKKKVNPEQWTMLKAKPVTQKKKPVNS